MEKQAISLSALSKVPWGAIGRPVAGGLAGGAVGYYGTPHIAGYADVPEARRVSAYTDAAMGALLGGMGGKHPIRAFKGLPNKAKLGIPLGLGIGEIPPLGVANLTKQRQTAEKFQDAAQQVAAGGIPAGVSRALTSSTGRGAAAGAGAAGLAALLTGLLRRRSEKERLKHRGRGGMVSSDFLKYLLPALIAGGVAGSFGRKPTVQQ